VDVLKVTMDDKVKNSTVPTVSFTGVLLKSFLIFVLYEKLRLRTLGKAKFAYLWLNLNSINQEKYLGKARTNLSYFHFLANDKGMY
jgi:hypothetical protein